MGIRCKVSGSFSRIRIHTLDEALKLACRLEAIAKMTPDVDFDDQGRRKDRHARVVGHAREEDTSDAARRIAKLEQALKGYSEEVEKCRRENFRLQRELQDRPSPVAFTGAGGGGWYGNSGVAPVLPDSRPSSAGPGALPRCPTYERAVGGQETRQGAPAASAAGGDVRAHGNVDLSRRKKPIVCYGCGQPVISLRSVRHLVLVQEEFTSRRSRKRPMSTSGFAVRITLVY